MEKKLVRKNNHIKTGFLLLIFFLAYFISPAQNQTCAFDALHKQGTHYFFATYYEDNARTKKKEGQCNIYSDNILTHERTFRDGKLVFEKIYELPKKNPDLKPVPGGKPLPKKVKSEYKVFPKTGKASDTLISVQTIYRSQDGLPFMRIYYYKNKAGRRMELSERYFQNNRTEKKTRRAFLRASELELGGELISADKIDDEGYCERFVTCGPEETFYLSGTKKEIINREFKVSAYDDLSATRSGETKGWFENGNIQKEGAYKNGLAEGEWKYYYPNGQINQIAHYGKNLFVGITKGFLEDGKLSYTYEYHNWKYSQTLPNTLVWNKSGLKIRERILDSLGNGVERKWNDEGKLIFIQEYRNGKADGSSRHWHVNGKLQKISNPPSSGNDTLWATWEANGQLRELNLVRKDGDFIKTYIQAWSSNGVKVIDEYHEEKNGKATVITKHYLPNGNQKYFSIVREEGKYNYQKYWNDNGFPMREILLRDGMIDSLFREWHWANEGKPAKEFNYSKGTRHGMCKSWNEKGELTFQQEYHYGKLMRKPKSIEKEKKKNLCAPEEQAIDVCDSVKLKLRELTSTYLRRLYLSDTTLRNKPFFTETEIDSVNLLFGRIWNFWKTNTDLDFPIGSCAGAEPFTVYYIRKNTASPDLEEEDKMNRMLIAICKKKNLPYPEVFNEYGKKPGVKILPSSAVSTKIFNPFFLEESFKNIASLVTVKTGFKCPAKEYYSIKFIKVGETIEFIYSVNQSNYENYKIHFVLYADGSIESKNQQPLVQKKNFALPDPHYDH